MSQRTATLVQIGQLLIKSGLLTQEQLDQALERAKDRGVPVGSVLLTMGFVKPEDFRAAIEAQALVNDGLAGIQLIINALAKVHHKNCTLEDALTSLGWTNASNVPSNKLGDLIVDAGMLNEQQLAECLAVSLETGMPLGRVISFKRYMREDLLVAVLRAQRAIREGTIGRYDAVNALKDVKFRSITFEESLAQSGFLKASSKRTIPVGFLLVEAGLVAEVDLLTCAELCITQDRTLAEVLVDQQIVSVEIAQALNEVQQLADLGSIEKSKAAEALRLMHDELVPLGHAVAIVSFEKLEPETRAWLTDLFVLSGMLEPSEVPQLTDEDFENYSAFQDAISQHGKISPQLIDALARSLFLIQHKMISVEDAVMALHRCRKSYLSFDQALNAMGWKPQPGRKV